MTSDDSARVRYCEYCGTGLDVDGRVESTGSTHYTGSCLEYVHAALRATKRDLATVTQSLATRDAEIRGLRGALERCMVEARDVDLSGKDPSAIGCMVSRVHSYAAQALDAVPPAPTNPRCNKRPCVCGWSDCMGDGTMAATAPAEPDAMACLAALVDMIRMREADDDVARSYGRDTEAVRISDEICVRRGFDSDGRSELESAVALLEGRGKRWPDT